MSIEDGVGHERLRASAASEPDLIQPGATPPPPGPTRGGATARALRDSEEKYRMLLDGVQDHAIFMLDQQGLIVSWNAGAERIKGYTADQIIGRDYACFYLPEDIQRGRPAGTPDLCRQRSARRTNDAGAQRWLPLPGERRHYGPSRPRWCSPGVLGDCSRPNRE
jgi:PAS domain S-box-containing protein